MNELNFETCNDVCNPNGSISAYWQCPTVCQPDCGGCFTDFVPDHTEEGNKISLMMVQRNDTNKLRPQNECIANIIYVHL